MTLEDRLARYAAIMARHEAGASETKIGRELGLQKGIIVESLRLARRNARILAMRDAGASYVAISRELGLTMRTIGGVVKYRDVGEPL